MNTKRHITRTLAASALAVVAACQNSPVLVDTELEGITLSQPDKDRTIEFATFADRSTRAAATVSDLEFYHPTFKVYGTKTSNGGDKVQPIFEGVTVTVHIAEEDTVPNTWVYDTDRYWDKQADYYQFVAYAPAHAPIAYQHNLVEVNHPTATFYSHDYTLIGQNLMQGAPTTAEKNAGFTGEEGTDCDVMRSEPFAVTDPNTTPVVTFNFKHTLAKLNVTAKANADAPYVITIDSVCVAGLLSTGSYDHTNGWEAKGTNLVDYVFDTPATAITATTKTYVVESLVMPQDIAATQLVTLCYTITSGTYSEEFTYTTTLADLFANKATQFEAANSYTVNFNIAPEKNIITFEAGVTAWEEHETNNNIE